MFGISFRQKWQCKLNHILGGMGGDVSDIGLAHSFVKIGHEMCLVVRKPVFGVSDQVPHKPGCTATEDA